MHNKQNTQLHCLLHNLLISLISLLSLLGATQCNCNPAADLSEKLEITTNKTCLRASEGEFEVIVKPAEDSHWPVLTDWKLKVQFSEQEVFGKKDVHDSSYLSHKHIAGKQNFTTSFMIPLTEYIAKKVELEEEQNELRIPIILHPASQATKLKVGIELIDAQNNMLQNVEVIWVKNELLISDITTVENQEGLANLTLKNTKDTPLKTSNMVLYLKSDPECTLLFSKTNTSQATLEELWDNHTTLDSGAETSPISLQLKKTTEGQALVNLTTTIQEGDKTLAIKTLPWPLTQTTDAQLLQPKKQQQENQLEEAEHPTTLPNLQMKVENMTNKKFKLFIENTGQKISKALLHHVKLKYSVQGTGDTTNARLKRGSLVDINGTPLVELIRSGLQEGQTKELEIILEPGNADNLTIQLFLEGTKNDNLTTFNWSKKKKPIKKEETTEKGKEQTQQATGQFKENLEEAKGKTVSLLPNLLIHIKTDSRSPKIFKVVVTNQGESISEDMIKNVRLCYTMDGTGDMAATYLKTRRDSKDISGAPLLDFIKSGLKKDQTKEFELIIAIGNARTLTINLTLIGTQNSSTAIFKWTNKKELKEEGFIQAKEPIPQAKASFPEASEQVLIKEKKQVPTIAKNLLSRPVGTPQEEQVEIQQTTSNLKEGPAQAPAKEKKQVPEPIDGDSLKEVLQAASKEPIQEAASNLKEQLQEAPQEEEMQPQESIDGEGLQEKIKRLQEIRAKYEQECLQFVREGREDYELTKKQLESHKYH